MSKVGSFAGYLWALPLTLFGLVYVTVFTALGWYEWVGRRGDALVWRIDYERLPRSMTRGWCRSSHTLGNVVVVRHDLTSLRGAAALLHEQEHVRQSMVLGLFQPVLYIIFWATIRLACPRSSPLYSNPFEVEARRAAGQVVDVEGIVQQISTRLKKAS